MRLRHRLLSALGHSDFTRFVVLSRSRTGSTMLMSFLDSHPRVHAEGEICRMREGRDLANVLARVFARQPRRMQAAGFKIFYYHPLDDDSREVWEHLVRIEDLRVIHLKRRNVLRTLVSRAIAGEQGTWELDGDASGGGTADKAVTLSVDDLSKGFAATRAWERAGDRMFARHAVLTVTYEDLVEDPDGSFAAIAAFLQVDRARPTTTLRRQNPEALRELVTNYDELEDAFAGTEWAVFFDE